MKPDQGCLVPESCKCATICIYFFLKKWQNSQEFNIWQQRSFAARMLLHKSFSWVMTLGLILECEKLSVLPWLHWNLEFCFFPNQGSSEEPEHILTSELQKWCLYLPNMLAWGGKNEQCNTMSPNGSAAMFLRATLSSNYSVLEKIKWHIHFPFIVNIIVVVLLSECVTCICPPFIPYKIK